MVRLGVAPDIESIIADLESRTEWGSTVVGRRSHGTWTQEFLGIVIKPN